MRVDNAVLRHLNPAAAQGGGKEYLELEFSGIDSSAVALCRGVSQVGIALMTAGQRPALSIAEFFWRLSFIANGCTTALPTIKQQYSPYRPEHQQPQPPPAPKTSL